MLQNIVWILYEVDKLDIFNCCNQYNIQQLRRVAMSPAYYTIAADGHNYASKALGKEVLHLEGCNMNNGYIILLLLLFVNVLSEE